MVNQALCARSGNVPHGFNSDQAEITRIDWESARTTEMTIRELLHFLYQCHKNAPFLNFNGNVFGEIARRILAVSLLGMPVKRMEAACSLAAHSVAGVLDFEAAVNGINSLLTVEVLRPGDRVSTLRMTTKGKVTRILADGRLAWLPDGRKTELLAAPETLIKIV